jgi:RNAse (barnase) inhibitor barstar
LIDIASEELYFMSNKRVYEIDGAAFSTLEEFYLEISRKIAPSAGWGHNLEAFNDILRGGFGTPDEGFVLRWKNSGLSKDRLGYAETVRQLELRLQRCHPTNRTSVNEDLDEARRGEGSTVFDWLVDIIKKHCSSGSDSESGVKLELQ